MPENYGQLHPFYSVPVLEHQDFTLYETAAITRYIDEAFPKPPLQPGEPRQRARMVQIIAAVDAYGYWPLVRQVFSQRVFGPAFGEPVDQVALSEGLESSKIVLAALEDLAAADVYLAGGQVSLADFHLAAMIDYFAMAAEGAALLDRYPKLTKWWSHMERRDSVVATTLNFKTTPTRT